MHRTRTKRKPLQLEPGQWCRFSRYELANGYIRPVVGATLERYRLTPDLRDADGRRPYETLAEMLSEGRYTVSGGVLTPDTEERLLTWCRQFGLLGVLLQRVVMAVFPPRSLPARRGGLWTSQTRVVRTPSDWQVDVEVRESATEEEFMSSPVAREVGVTLHPVSSFEISREPFAKTWGKFFPSVPLDQPETYSYPLASDQFFGLYQEPIDEFFRAAAEVSEALSTIAHFKKQAHPNFGPLSGFESAIGQLNGLAGSVRTQFDPKSDGSLIERWIAPTLLASLATMALRDLGVGQDPRICDNPTCRKFYVSGAHQARYCSKTCRGTVNKRSYRDKNPGKGRKSVAARRKK